MKIFEPHNDKDLRERYPELNDYEELKDLSAKELIFVWYFACKSSPYYGLEDSKRVLKSAKHISLSDEEYERYIELRFPERIQFAIQIMKNFSPEVRAEANTINTNIFDNLNKASKIDVSSFEDIEDKKNIIAMQISIAKNLPDIVRAVEQGFGIVKKKGSVEENLMEKSFD